MTPASYRTRGRSDHSTLTETSFGRRRQGPDIPRYQPWGGSSRFGIISIFCSVLLTYHLLPGELAIGAKTRRFPFSSSSLCIEEM